jgi:hypothetical protein
MEMFLKSSPVESLFHQDNATEFSAVPHGQTEEYLRV